MSRRNIANYTTFNSLLVNYLEIQNTGVGFTMYDDDINNPIFSLNATNQTFNMTGSLNVVGDASFNTIVVNEFEGGLQALASTNPGDSWDLGMYGKYEQGGVGPTDIYTGIVRDASDSLKRWVFFDGITTQPVTDVGLITASELSGVRMKKLYVDVGTVSLPSITFDADDNTGFYRVTEDEIGITAGGTKIAGIRRLGASSTEFELNTNTVLKVLKLNTLNDAASNNSNISTGSLYIESNYNEAGNLKGNDKWLRMYSGTALAQPSYAGLNLAAPTNNYFITNTDGALHIKYNTDTNAANIAADYRSATISDVLTITTNSVFRSHLPVIIPTGTTSNLSLYGYGTSTGIFGDTNNLGINCAGSLVTTFGTSNVLFAQRLSVVSGSVSSPAIYYTSDPNTGIYSSGSDEFAIATGGVHCAKFMGGATPQLIMPGGGSAAAPRYSFDSGTTGMYLPTNEAAQDQLAFSLGGVEIMRLRSRSGVGIGDTELYNSVVVTPNGTSTTGTRVGIYDTRTAIANTLQTFKQYMKGYNSIVDTNTKVILNFDTSTTADSSPNGYNAVATGTPTIKTTEQDTNGVVKRNVLNLTANTSGTHYLSLTSNVAQFTSMTTTTISFWFKVDGTTMTTDGSILNMYSPSGDIYIRILNSTKVLSVNIAGNSTTLAYNTVASVADNLWHHAVVRIGVVAPVLYLDNVALQSINSTLTYTSVGNGDGPTSTNNISQLSGITQFTIGARYTGSAVSLKYVGYIKDMYITSRSLTATEVSTFYTSSVLETDVLNVGTLNASNVSIDNQLYFADGTATAPGMAFASDTNTGIYRITADSLGISTGGAERVRVTSALLSYNSMFTLTSASDVLLLGGNATTSQIQFRRSTTTYGYHRILNTFSLTDSANYMDFYLWTPTDGGEVAGTHQIMRLGQRNSGATGTVDIYGEIRTEDGSVSLPAFSFTNDTNSGVYRIGADNLGVAAGGVLKLDIGSTVSIGNASGDTTTKLYVPMGTAALPTFGFIGDTNTGIYSSAADNVDVSCGGTQVATFSTASQLNKVPMLITTSTGTDALVVRKTAAASSVAFSVDVTNTRLGFGYTNLYIGRSDAYDSTSQQRLSIDAQSTNTQVNGLDIYNTTYNATGATTSQLTVGKDTNTLNSGTMLFYYAGNGSTSNRLSLGINGVNINMLQASAAGVVRSNVAFEAGSTVKFEAQVDALSGSAAAPSYSFTGDLVSGMYRVAANQVGFATNSNLRMLVADTYVRAYQPVYLPNGSVSAPALTFNSDTSNDSGLYYISDNSFGVANGSQNTWIWNNRSTSAHECLNVIDFKPNGTSVAVRVDSEKLRASAAQTILEDTPTLHFKFLTNPTTDTTGQDSSINKAATQVVGTVTISTSTISLTDTNGLGLLEYSALDLTSGVNGVETTTVLDEFTLMSSYKVTIKFKLKSLPGAIVQLFAAYGDSGTTNYVRIGINASNKVTLIFNINNVVTLNTSSAQILVADTWYVVAVNVTASANSMSINGVAETLGYTTGTSSTGMTFAGFSVTSGMRAVVGGSNSVNAPSCYISEVCVSPLTITQSTATTIRTQAHEVYANRLQLAPTTGLVDEGYILRSDVGNNIIWDNSVQIKPSSVELTGSKVLRVPAGTVSNPAVAFSGDVDTGLYWIGANNLGVSVGGSKKIDVAAAAIKHTVPTSVTWQSGSAQILLERSDAGTGFSARIFDSSAVTGIVGSTSDVELLAATSNSYLHLAHNSSSSGRVLVRNSNATGQTRFAMYGSDGTNYSQSLDVTTVDSGSVADCRIHARSANDAANPTYSFFGNTAAGVYAIGSNNIGVSTNGVKRIDVADNTTQIDNDLQLNSGFRRNFEVDATTSIVLDSTHCVLEVSNTGTVTVTLPECTTAHRGREYHIIKTGATGTVNINTFDANDHIDGSVITSLALTAQYDRVTLFCNGVGTWYTM